MNAETIKALGATKLEAKETLSMKLDYFHNVEENIHFVEIGRYKTSAKSFTDAMTMLSLLIDDPSIEPEPF